MDKKILTSLTAFALCATMAAQGIVSGPAASVPSGVTGRHSVPAKAHGSKEFTYFGRTGMGTLGEEAPAAYDCAIFVPAEYAGKHIEKVEFLLCDPSLLVAPKMWISSVLPATAGSADGVCVDITAPVSYMTDFTAVPLETPYTIPQGGCYVGYSFSIADASTDDGKYPVITGPSDEPAVSGGHYLRASLTEPVWRDMSGTTFGNLTTTVTISGDYPETGVTVAPAFASESRAVRGKGGKVALTVSGEGTTAVSSLDYTVTNTATGRSYDMHADLSENPVEFATERTVALPIEAEEASGTARMKIVISKVNGQPNAFTENISSQGSLLTLAAESKRRIVEEEFTATGCGYCPRGITGMRLMKERYPDSFIGIAVHDKMGKVDPMKISVYNNVVALYGASLPSATLNRTSAIDPYYGSDISFTQPMFITNDYEALLDIPVECSVDVTPSWNDAEYTQIKVSTDVTFQYNSSSAPFALAYVVVADGLTGTTQNWYQSNYFSGKTSLMSDENMREWITSPPVLTDMVYNDVAIAAIGVTNGLKSAIKAPLVEGVTQKHEYVIEMAGNKLLQDKSKLRVVAMLLNTKTGEIVNADEKALPYDGPSVIRSVSEVSGDVRETVRYTVDGRRTDGKAGGLTIVRMSDGTARKVIRK